MLTTLPDILRVRAQSKVLHVSFSLRACTPPLKLSNRRRGANDHTPIQPGVNSLSFLTPDLDPTKNQAQRLCSQRTRNKLMHAITGNTTTTTRPKLTLRLEALLPISPISDLQYSKYTLLQFRGVCSESPPLLRLEPSVPHPPELVDVEGPALLMVHGTILNPFVEEHTLEFEELKEFILSWNTADHRLREASRDSFWRARRVSPQGRVSH